MLNCVIAIHAKPKSGDLTRSIRDDRTVQITILVAKELSLVSTKCYSHLKIQFLTSIDCMGLVYVWIL